MSGLGPKLKDTEFVALGSGNADIHMVKVKQMEHALVELRHHISSPSVMNLLEEVPELAFAKFNPSVILLAGTQGVGKRTLVTTLQIKILLCQVTLTCLKQLRDARFLFSSGLIDSHQVKLELSSLSHSSTSTVLMLAGHIILLCISFFKLGCFCFVYMSEVLPVVFYFPTYHPFGGYMIVSLEVCLEDIASYGVWGCLVCPG